MKSNITVIDDICGRGKSTLMINMMSQGINRNRYIYITPFLSEVKRIRNELPDFVEPDYDSASSGSKLNDLKILIRQSKNIASTHALFRLIDKELIDLIRNKNYILVIDEILDVVSHIPASKDDINIMLNNYAHFDNNGKVIWDYQNYSGKFDEYKRFADNENLYAFCNSNNTKFLIWNFPCKIFEAVKKTFICTYMFDCQLMAYYLKYHNIHWQLKSIDDYHQLCDYIPRKLNKSLIDIIDDKKYNAIGDKRTALSKTWFNKRANLLNQKLNASTIKHRMESIVKNEWHCIVKDIIWTTYKDIQYCVKGKGYTRAFIPCNSRATNDYQDRHYIMYGCNLFFEPVLKKYFEARSIATDEDNWALSMLIQFLCRSAIRREEKIHLYIPSKRMRSLLIHYLQ